MARSSGTYRGNRRKRPSPSKREEIVPSVPAVVQTVPAHPLHTPRSAVVLALVGIVLNIALPFLSGGFAWAAIIGSYLIFVAILWLCAEEAKALGRGIKSGIVDFTIIPKDFWVPVLGALLVFGIATYITRIINIILEPPLPGPIISSQVQELGKLQDFVGGLDEIDLRDLFDFPGIAKFNVLLVRRSLNRANVSDSESQQIDKFFTNGNAQLDITYGTAYRLPDGTIGFKAFPGKVAIINTTKKYAQSRANLAKFIASPLIPTTITDDAREMDKAVTDDISLLRAVINENMGNPWDNTIENVYVKKFINLKPKADKITADIRGYLRIN
jgi:hypothetical protein